MKKKIKEKMYAIAGFITAAIMSLPIASLATPSSIADKASKGISQEAKKTVWPIAIVALIFIAIAFVIGGDRSKEFAKSKAGYLIFGVLIVVFAGAIIAWFKGIIQ